MTPQTNANRHLREQVRCKCTKCGASSQHRLIYLRTKSVRCPKCAGKVVEIKR